MGPVRLALVADQPLFTRGLELLLPAVTQSRVRVVATTADASQASAVVLRHRPDLAVVDLALAEPGGLRAISAIRRVEPDVPVLAMSDGHERSASDDRATAHAVDALRAGASGVVCKTTEPEDFVAPLLAAVDGWAVVPREVLLRLVTSVARARPAVPTLTDDDRELWRMIASGSSVQAIAVDMHVSDRTAKRLIAALLRRLKVATRTEAATLAGRSGLLDPADG
jgi:DNA-binding NarL/FixJ family response regulator